MAVDRLLERIANVESGVEAIKHDIGILIDNLQTVQCISNNIINYLISMIISDNDGDREVVIKEVKFLYKGIPDKLFNENMIPIIDKMIEIYNSTDDKLSTDKEGE
jgi:hypothetical protein